MDADYEKQRLEARNRYSRTVDDGSRIDLRVEGDTLVVNVPVRLDYLVTDSARREAKAFSGKFRGMEIRCHQTEYLDSSGLGFLLGLRALMPDTTIKPRITGVRSSGVSLPLKHAKFDLLFEMA